MAGHVFLTVLKHQINQNRQLQSNSDSEEAVIITRYLVRNMEMVNLSSPFIEKRLFTLTMYSLVFPSRIVHVRT